MLKQMPLPAARKAAGNNVQSQWATLSVGFASPADAPALVEADGLAVGWATGYAYAGSKSSGVAQPKCQ